MEIELMGWIGEDMSDEEVILSTLMNLTEKISY